MEREIDELDAKIIRFLQRDGRMPYIQIARQLDVTEPTVRTRVQRMLKEDVIQIIAQGNPIKLGFNLAGNLKIRVDFKHMDHIISELRKIKEIWYVATLTGASDLDVEFIVTSMEALKDLIFRVNNIEGIKSTESSLIMSVEKENFEWGTALDQ